MDDIDSMLKGVKNKHFSWKTEPKDKPEVNMDGAKRSYPKDRQVPVTILIRAKYK